MRNAAVMFTIESHLVGDMSVVGVLLNLKAVLLITYTTTADTDGMF